MLRCTYYTHHLSSCPLGLMGETKPKNTDQRVAAEPRSTMALELEGRGLEFWVLEQPSRALTE